MCSSAFPQTCSDILRNPEICSNQGTVSYQFEQCGYSVFITPMGDITFCYACVSCIMNNTFGKPFKHLTRMVCSAEFLDCSSNEPGQQLVVAIECDSWCVGCHMLTPIDNAIYFRCAQASHSLMSA